MSTVARLWSVANPSPRISKNLQESPRISENLQESSKRIRQTEEPKDAEHKSTPGNKPRHWGGGGATAVSKNPQTGCQWWRQMERGASSPPRQPKFPRIQRMLQATPRGQSGSHFMPMLAAGPWAGSHTHTPTHARAHGDAHTQAHRHTHTHTHTRARTQWIDWRDTPSVFVCVCASRQRCEGAIHLRRRFRHDWPALWGDGQWRGPRRVTWPSAGRGLEQASTWSDSSIVNCFSWRRFHLCFRLDAQRCFTDAQRCFTDAQRCFTDAQDAGRFSLRDILWRLESISRQCMEGGRGGRRRRRWGRRGGRGKDCAGFARRVPFRIISGFAKIGPKYSAVGNKWNAGWSRRLWFIH